MNAKSILPSIVLIMLSFDSPADLLIYNYSGKQSVTQSQQEMLIPFSGAFFYDLATTNVTNVRWQNVNNEKRVWKLPAVQYVAVVIDGKGTTSFTALAGAPSLPQ